jgi:transcriptional regulator with XRE-family HTH domain
MKMPTIKTVRKELGRSQEEMAGLLGISAKAVQSYEQGWRRAPPHVEQLVLLHAILLRRKDWLKLPQCWRLTNCPQEVRDRCPAYSLSQSAFCWLATGTLCRGKPTGSWEAKRRRCFKCKVMKALLEPQS